MVLAFLLTWKPKTLSSKKTIWSCLFYSLRQQHQWNVTFQVLTIHWKAPLMWQQWMRSLVMLGLWGSAIIIVWWTVNKVSQHRRDCLIIHLEEIERVRENVLERNALNKQHCLKKVTWHKTKYGDPILGICALHLSADSLLCFSTQGEVGGSVPCSRAPQSWYCWWRECWIFTPPPPTVPAGSRLELATFWL